MPPLNAIVQDAIKAGVEVCACGPSPEVLKQWGISPETIEPGVAIEDVMGFLDSALPAAQQGGIVTFI
jgi:predicted peroxiredoxin